MKELEFDFVSLAESKASPFRISLADTEDARLQSSRTSSVSFKCLCPIFFRPEINSEVKLKRASFSRSVLRSDFLTRYRSTSNLKWFTDPVNAETREWWADSNAKQDAVHKGP